MKKILIVSSIAACFTLGAHTQAPKLESYTAITQKTYPFTLPVLPYVYDALTPYIDIQTMRLHHDKHHQAYIDKLNGALKDVPQLHKKSLAWLLTHLDQVPSGIRKTVQDNAGGHFNHSLFWQYMNTHGRTEPLGSLAHAITKQFGSFKKFKEKFNEAAKSVFGSGWAWLCKTSDGTLVIIATPNQDTPLDQKLTPLMGLDVWEHAYYLKYHNVRPDYINAWWSVVNWPFIEQTYAQLLQAPKN